MRNQKDKDTIDREAKLFAEKVICDFNVNCLCSDKNSLSEFHEELVKKYLDCYVHLDTKFINDILSSEINQTVSCLWEIILLDSLLKNNSLKIKDHKDDGPDWNVEVGGKSYYIEATCAHTSDISISEHRRVKEQLEQDGMATWDGLLARETKSRVSSAISSKIKKHRSFIHEEKCGYVLCVSAGSLPQGVLGLEDLVSTVLSIGASFRKPFSNLPLKLLSQSTFKTEMDKKNEKEIWLYKEETKVYCKKYNPESKQKCSEIAFGISDELSKQIDKNFEHAKPKLFEILSEKNFIVLPEIPTDILHREENNWISAVLFSEISLNHLFQTSERVYPILWPANRPKNDFVLVLNKNAKYPLEMDVFGSAQIKKFDSLQNEIA